MHYSLESICSSLGSSFSLTEQLTGRQENWPVDRQDGTCVRAKQMYFCFCPVEIWLLVISPYTRARKAAFWVAPVEPSSLFQALPLGVNLIWPLVPHIHCFNILCRYRGTSTMADCNSFGAQDRKLWSRIWIIAEYDKPVSNRAWNAKNER